MEVIADVATFSYSSSSTEEYPHPYQHQYQYVTTKRKRTVRPRGHSLPVSAASSATSASDESSSTTTEEEDMAHCLILLARGRRSPPPPPPEKSSAGVYECKTCNKCFSSFQALGGHRASHKKPKTAGPLEAQRVINMTNDIINIGEAINIENSKMKIHECSICGAEFSSGQALGGHMRRHRSVVAGPAPSESPETAKKERNFLSLDLNLPPTSDGDLMSSVALSFVERRPLVFSTAPALVDCYY